jgi:large subunit ribosomal protein L25
MYGHAGVSTVSVDEREFGQKFKRITENTIISLSFEGKSHDVLVKDFQEDALTGRITHIDFFEIESGKVLRTNVPVHLTGSAGGVREGGLLEHRLHEIEVECLPKDIPENISIDITALAVGDAIHVGDLPAIEGVKVLNTSDQIVVTVTHPKEEVLVAEEEGEGLAEGAAEGEAEADSAETDEE